MKTTEKCSHGNHGASDCATCRYWEMREQLVEARRLLETAYLAHSDSERMGACSPMHCICDTAEWRARRDKLLASTASLEPTEKS